MSSRRGKVADRGLDFFSTPPDVVHAILPHLPRLRPFDPCAGDGALLTAAWGGGFGEGYEIDEERARAARVAGHFVDVRDALSPEPWRSDDGEPPELVLQNPPFLLAEEFVRRAIAEVAPVNGTVAVLLRLAFLESVKRASFHVLHPSDVFVLSKRPSFMASGKTDSSAYGWFVFGPGRGGRWRVLPPPEPAATWAPGYPSTAISSPTTSSTEEAAQ